MRQEKGLQTVVIAVLAVAILVMSVGFAAYSQTLNINGTATFTAAKWDVHFDTGTFAPTATSNVTPATEPTVATTSVTYNVTLPKPGSEYSFNINVKNFGTIDAVLKSITLSGLTDAQKKYIDYSVKYGSDTYTQTTTGLSTALAANASETVTVTVKYVAPASETDLPQTDDVNVSLTAALAYESTGV